ncbi:MAG: hypothetical protein LQ342_007981 [Letrouitia transgressa]|nr:MAG: hypothetical protein LQ342_007981 [Letrouitia transgressa]
MARNSSHHSANPWKTAITILPLSTFLSSALTQNPSLQSVQSVSPPSPSYTSISTIPRCAAIAADNNSTSTHPSTLSSSSPHDAFCVRLPSSQTLVQLFNYTRPTIPLTHFSTLISYASTELARRRGPRNPNSSIPGNRFSYTYHPGIGAHSPPALEFSVHGNPTIARTLAWEDCDEIFAALRQFAQALGAQDNSVQGCEIDIFQINQRWQLRASGRAGLAGSGAGVPAARTNIAKGSDIVVATATRN